MASGHFIPSFIAHVNFGEWVLFLGSQVYVAIHIYWRHVGLFMQQYVFQADGSSPIIMCSFPSLPVQELPLLENGSVVLTLYYMSSLL